MLDDELEIETVDLVGALPEPDEETWELPTKAIAAPAPSEPSIDLTPELREVFDEVLSTLPTAGSREVLALVKRWIPVLGPGRFYSVFWIQVGMQVASVAKLDEAMAAAHAEDQKTRYVSAEVRALKPTSSDERRAEVAKAFGAIIRRIQKEPGFDYRAAIDEATARLGIRR